jgi:hypothetical protein
LDTLFVFAKSWKGVVYGYKERECLDLSVHVVWNGHGMGVGLVYGQWVWDLVTVDGKSIELA